MLGVSPLFRPEFVPSAQKTGSAVVIDGQTAGRQGRLGGRLRTTAGHPDESGCGTYEYVRHNVEMGCEKIRLDYTGRTLWRKHPRSCVAALPTPPIDRPWLTL